MLFKIYKRSDILTKDLIPIKIPYLVMHGYSFVALICIATFPLSCGLNIGIADFSQKHFTFIPYDIRMEISFIISFMVPLYFAISVVSSRTSKFILEVVEHHLKNNDKKKAEKVALVIDYQVLYREYKRNDWFRIFVLENNLIEKSEIYRKYENRYNRRRKNI